jgi:SAM-dependent methyltransferase
MHRRLRASYAALWHGWSSTVVDPALGVETAGRLDLSTVGLDGPGRVSYAPAGWLDLPRILPRQDVCDDDVFLDLGAGKGRIVLMASRYPFARVIGVELCDDLTAIARRNVAACRLRPRCRDIELVTADVVDYAIPDDVSVVYMFNPFDGDVFDTVIERLIESADRRPRRLRLLYRFAAAHDRLMRTGRFKLVRQSRPLRPTRGWRDAVALRCYELQPAR